MTPGRRGCVVLVLFCIVASCVISAYSGYRHSERRWEGWTWEHVAFETKGSRQ